MKRIGCKTLIFLALTAALACWGNDLFRFESVGARFGFPAYDGGETFLQAEAFVDFDLPWHWRTPSQNWIADTKLDFSAGSLADGSHFGFIGTAGPILTLKRKNFPVALDFGFSPTILSEDRYPSTSFGTPLQFTSHAGLLWDVTKHLQVGYRIQHMSNGHLASPNPGLNLQMFTVGYRF